MVAIIAAVRWLQSGAGEVVVKNGGGPMAIARSGGSIETFTFESVKPVDSTGAGDSFNGGYLAARLSSREPDKAAVQGHQIAAQVVCRPGALIPLEYVAGRRF